MEILHRITTNCPTAVLPETAWANQALGGFLCVSCRKINRSLYPMALDITLSQLPDELSEGIVVQCSVEICRRELAKTLALDKEGFSLGNCYWRDGTLLGNYCTAYSDYYIIPRGIMGSKYWICKSCGSMVSSPARGPEYLLRRQLTRANVYQDAIGSLYLADELATQTDWSRWPDLYLETVDVRDAPIDGIILPDEAGFDISKCKDQGNFWIVGG